MKSRVILFIFNILFLACNQSQIPLIKEKRVYDFSRVNQKPAVYKSIDLENPIRISIDSSSGIWIFGKLNHFNDTTYNFRGFLKGSVIPSIMWKDSAFKHSQNNFFLINQFKTIDTLLLELYLNSSVYKNQLHLLK